MVHHMEFSTHFSTFAGTPCMYHTVSQCFQCLHSCLAIPLIPSVEVLSFQYPHGYCVPAPVSATAIERYFYSSAFHSIAINHCQFTSNWPAVSHAYASFHLLCGASLALYMILAFADVGLLRLLPIYFLLIANWHIYWWADSIHICLYASDFLVNVFCITVPGEQGCYI